MDEFKTDRATYTPNDFVTWQESRSLVISPKFQRRQVWRAGAKSYFIDTILRGMTVPPLYFRTIPHPTKKNVVAREVVDGQQRVRSVLEFISDDGFRLQKSLQAPWAGKRFSQLHDEQQKQVMSFGFPSETFKGISDQQVLEVFCRLNMNGIPLNKQELRNGKYFGLFKQLSSELGWKYLEFWRHHRIFSEQSIARMLEVELTSELLIAGNAGMQDKKSSIDSFYEKWETTYSTQEKDRRRFDETLAVISETFSNGDLAASAFRRPPLFYTLYCLVYHHLFGLPEVQRPSPKRKPTADERESLRDAVTKISDAVVQAKDAGYEVSRKLSGFVLASQRQTDNIIPRKTRFNTLYAEAF